MREAVGYPIADLTCSFKLRHLLRPQRRLVRALTGLNARGDKNSTRLFKLARVFIARSPARSPSRARTSTICPICSTPIAPTNLKTPTRSLIGGSSASVPMGLALAR